MTLITSPFSHIVRDFLVEEGVGVAWGDSGNWPIACNTTPDSPINLISLFDEAAQKKVRTVGSGVIENPVVSMEIRASSPDIGLAEAKRIQDVLDALSFWSWSEEVDSVTQTIVIANARRSRGIFPMGMDDNGRPKYNLEYAFVVQSITET